MPNAARAAVLLLALARTTMSVGRLLSPSPSPCSSVSSSSKWVSSCPSTAKYSAGALLGWTDGLVKRTRGGYGGSKTRTDQVEQQLEEVQQEIKEVQQKMKEVQRDIKQVAPGVQREIKKVQREMKEVLKNIDHEQDSMMKAVHVKVYERLGDRVKQLGDRVKQLGDREKHLGEREIQLGDRLKELNKERLHLQRQSGVSSKPRVIWIESEAGLDRIGFCHGKKYFRLDASYLQGDGEILLYCRESFHVQQRFLKDKVVDNRALGWIQGPPGTGKTTTTLAFCLSLCMKKWSITFFQLDSVDLIECIQIVGSKRRSCTIPVECTLKWTNEILQEWPDSEKRLVIIDGYLRHESHHVHCYRACTRWLLGDRENRRVVVVTSMSCGGKVRDKHENVVNLRRHTVVSWTAGEYLDAVKCDDFYMRVKPMLSLHDSAVHNGMRIQKRNGTKEEQIMSKYYLAGGSCRYMFEKTAAVVVERLEVAISSCRNLELLFQGNVGDSSPHAVNHLTARYMHDGQACWMPVSKYVATRLADEAKVDVLKRLLDGECNPSLRGYLFELLFFKKVKQGLTLTYRKHESRWEGCPVFLLDTMGVINDLLKDRTCLKPISVFQPGFDAIIVDVRAKLVEFVMVTVSSSHSFKLSPLAKALKKLNIPTKGWKVKVVFIVPPERLQDFRIDPIKHCGALKEYGWKKGQEGKQADVASIDIL